MVDWSKVEEVDPTMRSAWLPCEDASYTVEVKGVRTSTQKGTNKEFFIVEMGILESNTESVKTGESRSWVINMSNPDAYDAPFRDVKAFMCSALGIPVSDTATKKIGKKAITFAIGTDQPFKTLHMMLVTTARKTDEGGDFTQHTFTVLQPDRAKKLYDYFEANSLFVAASAA